MEMPADTVPIGHCETKSSHIKEKIEGPQTRWIIILMVVYFFLVEGFSKTCFGQVNNILSQFYDVDIQNIDWLTLAPLVSGAVSLFLMTWVSTSGLGVRLRKWCLTSAIFTILAWILIVLAVMYRQLFAFAVIGQITMGMASALNFALVPLATTIWFPEREQPIAVALTFSGLNVGHIMGFLIPSHMLPKTNYSPTSISAFHCGGEITDAVDWQTQVSVTLTAIFSSFLASSLIFGFFTFLFVFDSPTLMQTPSSNSNRELFVPQQQDVNEKKQSTFLLRADLAKSKMISWLRDSKRQLTSRSFVVIAVPYILTMSLCWLWFVLLSDMLRSSSFTNVFFCDATFPNKSSNEIIYSSNEIAGKSMSLFCVGSFFAGMLTRKLAQFPHFRYEYISCAAAWGVAVTTAGNYVSFTYGAIEAVFIVMFLFGFFVNMVTTALAALMTDRIANEDRLTVRLWLAAFSTGVASLLPLFGRCLFENFGPTTLHIFQIVITTVVAVFMMAVKRLLRDRSKEPAPRVSQIRI